MLLDIAPNGALPPSRLAGALQHIHTMKACNYTHSDLVTWSEAQGAAIRTAMSKVVELKSEPALSRYSAQACVPPFVICLFFCSFVLHLY